MKPTPDLVLNHAFAKVAMEMGPALPAGYGQGSATLTGVLILMVSQEFNRAADIRANENAAMRALFAEVAPSIGGDLGARLKGAAEAKDADINVATLDRSNAALKALLIELQVQAETAGTRALETRILKLLSEAAAARQIFLPAM
jgi:hypothetical protein